MRVEKETVRKAYELGEGTYKKLSEKYNVSQGTIKSWAKQDKDNNDPWIKPTKPTKPKTKNQVNKVESKVEVEENQTKKNNNTDKEVIESSSLTENQQLFCIYYIEQFNATRAYQKAYGCDIESARRSGSKLLTKVDVRAEVDRLTKECLQEKAIDSKLITQRVFEEHLTIAFADITDYMVFGQKDIEVMGFDGPLKDEQDNVVMQTVNYVDFKESTDIDGTLISEASKGKDGVKIKLHDKMKSLQWLSDRLDLLTDYNKTKLGLEKEKLEHLKGKDNQSDEPIAIRLITKGDVDGTD